MSCIFSSFISLQWRAEVGGILRRWPSLTQCDVALYNMRLLTLLLLSMHFSLLSEKVHWNTFQALISILCFLYVILTNKNFQICIFRQSSPPQNLYRLWSSQHFQIVFSQESTNPEQRKLNSILTFK